MKKLRKGIAAVVTASMLLSGYAALADDLDDQLQDAQDQAEAAKEKAAQADTTINSVLDKLRQIQSELDAANAELAKIQKQLNEVNANIQKTEAELRVAEAHLQQRQVILNQRVRNIYMHGQLNYIDVIIGSKNFSDFANRLELLKRIIHSDYDLINEIKAQKQLIQTKEQELEKQKQQIVALQSQAQKVQQVVAARKAEQQAVLAQARANKSLAVQEQQEMESASNDIRAKIQAREAAAAAASADSGSGSYSGGSSVVGTGVFMWPCNGPITSPFGYRVHPIFGTTIFHSGIDIGVDYGTPIVAADAGTVIDAGWMGGYGNAVIIDHGNGLQTVYGHNSSVVVSPGQTVARGQLIAYAGATGYATGPHCHFEVRKNGVPVDPMGYL